VDVEQIVKLNYGLLRLKNGKYALVERSIDLQHALWRIKIIKRDLKKSEALSLINRIKTEGESFLIQLEG
jgi:hypothetical protein